MVTYKITYTNGKIVENKFANDDDAIWYIQNEGDHVASYERLNDAT